MEYVVIVIILLLIIGTVYVITLSELDLRKQKKYVEGHNYRREHCVYPLNNINKLGDISKDTDWLRQRNKGRRTQAYKKLIYVNCFKECEYIVSKRGL